MGLILGVICCILAIPAGFLSLLAASDWETGTQIASPWRAVVTFSGFFSFGMLLIYSHYHSIW